MDTAIDDQQPFGSANAPVPSVASPRMDRLQEHSRRLLREYQRQAALLARLEIKDSELLRVDLDEQGAVVVSEADGEGDVNDLLTQIERAMNRR